jgi:MSHA biogenesis protein MshJ
MNQVWSRWSRRIDALSARERVILFVSIALGLVAATDALVLSPRAAAQKALAAGLRAQTAEIEALRQQIGSDEAGSQSPAARLLRELRGVQAERAEVDAEIQRRSAEGASTASLGALMERVLQRHERLTLLKLATGITAPVAASGLPMRSVEIGVRGNYLELTQYVAELERALPGLRWDELAMVRRDGASELRARVALPGDPR